MKGGLGCAVLLALALFQADAQGTLAINTTSLPAATLGTAYNQTLDAKGGRKPYTWSISAGALPAGLVLNATTGAITGTPLTAGTSSFTVRVLDAAGASDTQALQIVTQAPPLVITSSSLPAGAVGSAYSQTLAATGGTGGYTWSVTAGTLPAGLTLSASGTISGTPTTAGTSNFTAQVKDSAGVTASAQLSIAIAPPALSIATSSLPPGVVGTAYSQTLSATGGTGGYTWSVTSGSLPAGLALSGNGMISGTPTAAGTSNFTAQVKDSAGTTASAQLSIAIAAPALSIATSSLPPGVVGTAYSQTLSATGGAGGYSWSVTSGSLPAGLTLSGTGTISGTPTAPGASTFTVQVKDSAGTTSSAQLSIAISAPSLVISTTSLPAGGVGVGYSQTLSATGGTGGYSWSVTSGSLPAGLSLSAGGAITGSPTAAGTSNFTVQVKDSAGTTASAPLTITINPPAVSVTTASLPGATVGVPYSANLSATGGTGGFTWSVTSGSLPAGLSLSPSGTISGTPTAAGTSNFTAQAQDSSGAKATANLSIAVAAAVSITTSSLPPGIIGTAYSQTLTATGGSGGYVWSVAGGTLPPGLSLSAAGVLSGTPQIAGQFNFTAKVTDSASASATRALALSVAAPVTVNIPPSLATGEVGLPYSITLAASGGTGSYNWTVTTGQLPPGIGLDHSTGALTGTPTVAGTFGFTVRAADANQLAGSATTSIEVRPPVAITTDSTLAGASAGAVYSQALVATGGVAPYGWALISGGLPSGITLNSAGTVSGTPTQVGSFQFSAQVQDAAGATAQSAFSLTVASGLAIATAPTLPPGTSGVRYSVTLQPAGGTPPYVWAITSGSLPAGINFSSAGALEGTPSSAGNYTFTAQVTDGNSNRATKQFTLAIAGQLTITTAAALPGGVAGASYRQTLAAAGGTPPYLWTVTGGSLPPGLTLEGPTGILSGTPSAAGSYQFTVTLADNASVSVQRQFTIEIGQGVTITTPSSLPNATAGAAYSFTLGAAGGQAPYAWSITQGSLPPGLALNASSGIISGTPTSQGTYNFTVEAADAAGLKVSRVHTIVVVLPSSSPSLTLNGVSSTMAALQQPALDITLANTYPVAISGRLNVSFAPAGANPVDDPSIQFSTGGRSAAFTIPANSTHAVFTSPQFALQLGSVAGTLTLTIDSLQAGNTPLTAPAATTVRVAPAAPQIGSVTVVRQSSGFEVQVVAVSTTRELMQATVNFRPSAGSSLQTTPATVPLGPASDAWFKSSASAAYGGQFTLTLPFTFVGATGGLDSVSVTLANGAGASQEASAAY